MRIAIIGLRTVKISPPFNGETEQFIYNLSGYLYKQGFDIDLYTNHSSAIKGVNIVTSDDLNPFDLYESNKELQVTLDTNYFKEVFYKIYKKDYDIVIDSSLSDGFFHFAPFLDVPSIKIHHLPPYSNIQHSIDLEQTYFGNVHHVFLSETQKSFFTIDFNTSVIHRGVDMNMWKYQENSKDYIVWFGKITPDKGVHYAIKAAKILGKKLIILGEIVNSRYFDDYIASELGENIVYKGSVSQEELVKEVSHASCFAYTSTGEEPFGHFAAESLAAGVPVAGFDRGAINEIIIEDVGCITDDISGQGLAEAIRQCETKNRESCHKYALSRFGIEEMIVKYRDLIYSLHNKK